MRRIRREKGGLDFLGEGCSSEQGNSMESMLRVVPRQREGDGAGCV
jgi:hypothetical protein